MVVGLSLCLFCYTFVAKTHLLEHTRAFVTQKTLSYSKPLVEFTKTGLNTPLSQKLLSKELHANIQGELGIYDSNPVQYVAALTAKRKFDFGKGKIADFKVKVHKYNQSILEGLIRDLRIFSGSNLVAGIVALLFLLLTKVRPNGKVVVFSFVIFAAVALSTYSYVDGVSFLRILLKNHLGWWYPVGIVVAVVGLVLEHGLHQEDDVEQDSGRQSVTRPC